MAIDSSQSTNHIALVRPKVFFSNPQTQETNPYQDAEKPVSDDAIYQKALEEFYGFHHMLVENGIIVTVLPGAERCPDHIFPNFLGTHEKGKAILYPMMSENRARERTPEILSFVNRHYDVVLDMRGYEKQGKALEANASICLDRVNKIGYAALSARTDEGLAREWADKMDYELHVFTTDLGNGLPVYHTDLVMFIGDTFAGVCFEVMTSGQDAVRASFENTGHEIIEITLEQMNHMCGNALQVIGPREEKFLVMSSMAYENFREDQRIAFKRHVDHIIHAPIPTIEQYGGGSARCLIQELF